MRFRYSLLQADQDPQDSLPRLPLELFSNGRSEQGFGLVDSGSMLNVLPFSLGKKLGFEWADDRATIRLSGALRSVSAIPVLIEARFADFQPVRLAFAWTSSDVSPLI